MSASGGKRTLNDPKQSRGRCAAGRLQMSVLKGGTQSVFFTDNLGGSVMTTRRAVIGGLVASSAALVSCKWSRGSGTSPDANNEIHNDFVASTWTTSAQKAQIDPMGEAFDSAFGIRKGFLVTGNATKQSILPTDAYNPDSLKYELIESQSEYAARTRKSASASGKWKIIRAGGSGSSSTFKTNNSYSLHVVAMAIRNNPFDVFESSSIRLAPNLEREIQRLMKTDEGKRQLIADYGDSFIAGVGSGSELFIDMVFETTSASSRRDLAGKIGGSVAGIGSARGGYAQLIGKATSAKKITTYVSGSSIPVPTEFTGPEIIDFIKQFFADTGRRAEINYYDIRPVTQVRRGIFIPKWVGNEDLAKRKAFENFTIDCASYLDSRLADIDYVHDNPSEFEVSVQTRAENDRKAVAGALRSLVALADRTEGRFLDTGITDASFEIDNIKALMPEGLATYPQKEPRAQPQATPVPAPHEPAEVAGDRGGACCH